MPSRIVIGADKRRLLLICAVLLALAAPLFAWLRFRGLNGFIGMTTLAAAVYALCIGLSLYRPPVVIAFVGLLLDLLAALDFTRPVAAESGGSGVSDVIAGTSAAIGEAIVASTAQVGLLAIGFVLLLVVLTQRRWAAMIG